MKLIFETQNKYLLVLSYLQKIIATIFAVAFGLYYLVPALQTSTNLNTTTIWVIVLICIVVFELILHFALSSFINGTTKKEFRITELVGAGLAFAIIFYISLHSTSNLTSLPKEAISIDSIQKKHGEIIASVEKINSRRVADLDMQQKNALSKIDPTNWAYMIALKSFENMSSTLSNENSKSISNARSDFEKALKEAKIKNKETTKKQQETADQNKNSSVWIGLVVLAYSIYSTIMVGAYNKKQKEVEPTKVQETQSEEVQTKTEEVQTEVQAQTEVQEVQTEVQPTEEVQTENKLILVQMPKVSRNRYLATEYMQSEEFKNLSLKDKDKFALIQQKFAISWGTYSDIKREIKQSI